jgi:hypothetical protein
MKKETAKPSFRRQIDTPFDFMYFIRVVDNQNHGRMYPDFNKQTPSFVVRLERGKN